MGDPWTFDWIDSFQRGAKERESALFMNRVRTLLSKSTQRSHPLLVFSFNLSLYDVENGLLDEFPATEQQIPESESESHRILETVSEHC